VARAWHLVRRFVGSFRPGGPKRSDDEWVASVLLPGEYELWSRMSNPDRRHSVGAARRVERALAGTAHAEESGWLAAALLHDVGKLDAGLGTLRRVGATLAGAAAGHEMADIWSSKRGITRKVGLYLRHPELGETRIRLAGGRDVAARWASAHHEPARWDRLEIPAEVVAVLHDADDD